MGAAEFTTRSTGKTAVEAFSNAVSQAQYDHGHSGYSGSIAEKSSFKMVTPKAGESVQDCMDRCMEDEDHFCQDKWGDAACVVVSPGNYIFFGWASS